MKKLTEKSFQAELEHVLTVSDGYRLKELVESLVAQAIAGDVKAAAIVIDRFEGKMSEKIEVTGDETAKQLVSNATNLLKKIRGYQEAEEDVLIPTEITKKKASKTVH